MSQEIPQLPFRTPFGFSVKPDLEAPKGPAGHIVLGDTGSDAPTSAIFVGKSAERPYAGVWLDTEGAHVVYVMGKRRSGKSYTLGVLAEGLVTSGWMRQGDSAQGVLILDTMNVYLTMPFAATDGPPPSEATSLRTKQWKLSSTPVPVRLFRPRGSHTPPGLMVSEFALKPSDLGPEEWCGVFGADPLADPLGHLIVELHTRVAVDGYQDRNTGDDVPPNPEYGLHDLLSALSLDPALDDYHRDTREGLRRRLTALTRLPLFSDEGLNVRELLQPNVATVLLLRDLDQHLRSVLIGFVVRQVLQGRAEADTHERLLPIYATRARKLRSVDPAGAAGAEALVEECRSAIERGLPRSWLIIDEAHNYIPRSGFATSRRWLKKYVDEGRNLGLSIVVATQQPSGLDPSIQRNADILVLHALSHRDDVRAADGMINTSHPTEVLVGSKRTYTGPRLFESLLRQLPAGYALISNDKANRWIPTLVRPRVTVHGGQSY